MRILLIRVHDIEKLIARSGETPQGYQVEVTEADRVHASSFEDTAIRTGTFLRAALKRGDKLVAAYEDERIVSYGWCAEGPTPISRDLEISFDPSYIYGYRAHTSKRHRGRGLHTAVIRHAAATVAGAVGKGMVAYVDAGNDRSLISEARAGDLQTGVVIVWVGKKLRYWASPLCRRVGFSLTRRG
jgi:ribosomal protein S18 acetylase RimI-like enzyme